MGNFGKKLLGMGALGAAAGAAAYYFMKKKEENPELQEEFADFQDNLKETAASAVNVASKLKETVEKSLDDTLSKVKEHTDDFIDDDIFEDDDFEEVDFEDDDLKKTAKEVVDDIKEAAGDAAETVKETIQEIIEDAE